MAKDFFVGIDGGGSKTLARLESKDRKVLGEGRAGPANIRLSCEIAIASIREALQEAIFKAKLSEEPNVKLHVGLGLAGFEVQNAREEFLAKQVEFNFASSLLQSDAYVACLGAHSGNSGAIIIAGTGVVGLKITSGKKFQVGGWGFPHGDEGGAAWIGLETVRKTLQSCDGRVQSSPLLLYIKEKLGGKPEHITQWACYATASQFAELARDVFTFAEQKDPFAQFLLKEAAHHIENIFNAIEHSQKNVKTKLPYSLLGGVAPFILAYMPEQLQKRFVPARGDACDGALIMIREQHTKK